jgi:metal transporter CNNM
MLWLHALALAPTISVVVLQADDIRFGTLWWFVYIGVSCLLVLFAGIMSGLTLGLMSLGLVELEILQRSGTSAEKKQAGSRSAITKKKKKLFCVFRARKLFGFANSWLFRFLTIAAVILPVVQKQHQLLVTLLLCNACAMEVI